MEKSNSFVFQLFAAIGLIIASFLVLPIDGDAQSRPGGSTNAVEQIKKAYKTLDFGDDTKTVERKLSDLVGGFETKDSGVVVPINYGEMIWISLFNSKKEYESFDDTVQMKRSESLSQTFGIELLSYENSAFSCVVIVREPFVSAGK